MCAVDGDVGESRLGSADLDELALPLIAFCTHARQTTCSLGGIGVGKRPDHVSREHVDDVGSVGSTAERGRLGLTEPLCRDDYGAEHGR